jgi:hypothetical protein
VLERQVDSPSVTNWYMLTYSSIGMRPSNFVWGWLLKHVHCKNTLVELSTLRLTPAATRTIDVPGSVAGIVCRELHVNTGEFGGLSRSTQGIGFTEMN